MSLQYPAWRSIPGAERAAFVSYAAANVGASEIRVNDARVTAWPACRRLLRLPPKLNPDG